MKVFSNEKVSDKNLSETFNFIFVNGLTNGN